MITRHTYLCSLLAAILCLVVGMSKAQPTSDFGVDAESWNTVGQCPAESSPGATWQSTGGNPGGNIKAQDNSVGVFYWYSGGTEWKNDLSAYYGCYFYFDLKQSDAGLPVGSQYDLMILRGDDESIVRTVAPDPATSWTTYVIQLKEGSWTLGGPLGAADCPDLGGPTATYAEFISYLSDVKRFRIRAEYSGLSNETNRLDNVFIDCDPLLLPLIMESFSARDAGFNKAELTWSTIIENDTYGFQVEKSENGIVFDSIGFVLGNGSSTSNQEYQFIDHEFFSTAYYRLRQIDVTGTGFYSDIIALNTTQTIQEKISIYPNPAKQVLSINAYHENPIQKYRIIDISGKVRQAGTFNDVNGYVYQALDLTSLENGLYLLELSNSETTFIERFEVLK